jgi:hypothetical protein
MTQTAAWLAPVQVFAAAFVLDWIYVLWIRSRVPWRMGVYSGGIAVVSIIGLGGALQGHPVEYVLGYALGSFCVGLWTAK